MPDIELMGATYPDVPAVDLPKSGGGTARFYDPSEIKYAASETSGGPATRTNGLPYGVVDGTSTATAFTVTISGITTLYDGLCILVKNNVIASKADCTLNVNGLGAKRIHYNTASNSQITTQWTATMTAMFYYDSTRNSSAGAWVMFYGYDSNTNTIGYQVRSNSSSLPMTSIVYRYRLLFTSADNAHFVPANNSTSTNATSARTVCQDKIDPFGRIVYYGTTASVAAGSRPSAANLWDMYAFTLGYSFQKSPNYVLTLWKPVYLKCAPQTDGSAIIDSTTPFVQDLPTTEDGKIYIHLGVAYSETQIELLLHHPVYWYKDGMIRPYTNAPAGGAVASVNGQTGAVVLDADDVGALPDSTTIPSKTSDLVNDSGFITGMYIASYGHSTYADVLAAYKANKVVYCRASSSNPPSSGSQNRMAFLAYVSDPTTPTEFEFQYYRSFATHSDSQQGDQVFVYKLNSSTGWSVTTREAYTKIVAGTGLSSSYSSGTLTLTNSQAALPIEYIDYTYTQSGSTKTWSLGKTPNQIQALLKQGKIVFVKNTDDTYFQVLGITRTSSSSSTYYLAYFNNDYAGANTYVAVQKNKYNASGLDSVFAYSYKSGGDN